QQVDVFHGGARGLHGGFGSQFGFVQLAQAGAQGIINPRLPSGGDGEKQPVVRAASPAASGQKHHGDQNKNMGKPSHPSTPLRSIYSSNSDDKAVSIFDQTKNSPYLSKKDRWRRRQNPAHAAGSCSPPRRSFGSFRPFHFLRPSGRFRFGRVNLPGFLYAGGDAGGRIAAGRIVGQPAVPQFVGMRLIVHPSTP